MDRSGLRGDTGDASRAKRVVGERRGLDGTGERDGLRAVSGGFCGLWRQPDGGIAALADRAGWRAGYATSRQRRRGQDQGAKHGD